MQDFKETKIRINSPVESRLVQEKLFSLNICWGGTTYEVKNLNSKYLFISGLGRLTHLSGDEQKNDFKNHHFKEIFISDILGKNNYEIY